MANQTIQNSIDYSQTYIQYPPISAGTNNEPAVTIANMIQNLVVGPPFTWGWNRGENTSLLVTVAGTQDYTLAITDFGFLEKISLTDPTGAVFEVLDIKNTASLGKADASVAKRARPNAACVLLVTYGTSVKIRFMGVPDKIYTGVVTYQKLVAPMSALTGGSGTWTIPPQYSDVYNSLFLAESMAVVDDARAQQYRQRGVAALLAKAEGLTEMQKNMFLEQYFAGDRQMMAGTLRTQQGNQGRGV